MTALDVTALAAFRRLFDPTEWRQSTLDGLRGLGVGPLRTEPPLSIDDVTAVAGPLRVQGDLTVGSHLLVLGDLDVDGVLDVPPDHHILLVRGHVRCRALSAMRAYLLVDGDVVATELALLTTYGALQCTGALKTPLCLVDDTQAFYDLEQQESRGCLPAGAVHELEDLEGAPFTAALRAAGVEHAAASAFDLVDAVRAGARLR